MTAEFSTLLFSNGMTGGNGAPYDDDDDDFPREATEALLWRGRGAKGGERERSPFSALKGILSKLPFECLLERHSLLISFAMPIHSHPNPLFQ